MRGPLGLLKRVLLIEVAGTEVLGLRGVVAQSEASGQVGEVPAAESEFGALGPLLAGGFSSSGVSLLPFFLAYWDHLG